MSPDTLSAFHDEIEKLAIAGAVMGAARAIPAVAKGLPTLMKGLAPKAGQMGNKAMMALGAASVPGSVPKPKPLFR